MYICTFLHFRCIERILDESKVRKAEGIYASNKDKYLSRPAGCCKYKCMERFAELRFEQTNTSYRKHLTRYVSRKTETSDELYDNDIR